MKENAGDPPCPGCGLTAQVEPSRSTPGFWMCHGCAHLFLTAGVRDEYERNLAIERRLGIDEATDFLRGTGGPE
jgi:ribosomal protein L37AE/L43A